MAQVVLEGVTKVYAGGARAAVRGMGLTIGDRELVVLVGPSGCGKSTTLRLIAGLEEATAGTIRIGERVVNDVAPKDRDIAMVFQNYALYPHLSVFENMAFGLRMQRRRLGLSREGIAARVQEAARMLGLQELLTRRPRELSGGQRQRVAVGRAIVRHPQAFLFDEPLSNLDAKLRVETRAQLKRLHQQLGTTTIYVTHDQEEAMSLGDRIAVMKEGVIQQIAPPLEVYERPANRFVAGFVGMPAMNFFEGRVEGVGAEVHFACSAGRLRLSGAAAGAARAHGGGAIVLGVRPECLVPAEGGAGESGENVLAFNVNVVEPLGDRVDLYLSANGHDQVVCRADAHRYGRMGTGEGVRFRVDVERAHVFEAGEEGRNLGVV